MSVGQRKSSPGVHGPTEGSARLLENTIVVPSGDQEGQASFTPRVSRTASVPSASATKIPRSSTIGSWYAIFEPSGDHAICATGSPLPNTVRRFEPSGSTASIQLGPSPPPTRK